MHRVLRVAIYLLFAMCQLILMILWPLFLIEVGIFIGWRLREYYDAPKTNSVVEAIISDSTNEEVEVGEV